MGSEIARLLLIGGAMTIVTACDGGEKGNTPAPQASAMYGAASAATATAVKGAAINSIDRSFAGTPAPAVAFERKPGAKTSMAAFRGKRVLVNLWATWCAPCIAEMPALDTLAAARAGKLVILPISQDMEGWQAVNGFFKPGKFKTLQPMLDQPGSYAEALKARGLPISVLYDEKGREVWRVAGTLKWNSPEVAAALG